jgi:hypothetical protein
VCVDVGVVKVLILTTSVMHSNVEHITKSDVVPKTPEGGETSTCNIVRTSTYCVRGDSAPSFVEIVPISELKELLH